MNIENASGNHSCEILDAKIKHNVRERTRESRRIPRTTTNTVTNEIPHRSRDTSSPTKPFDFIAGERDILLKSVFEPILTDRIANRDAAECAFTPLTVR